MPGGRKAPGCHTWNVLFRKFHKIELKLHFSYQYSNCWVTLRGSIVLISFTGSITWIIIMKMKCFLLFKAFWQDDSMIRTQLCFLRQSMIRVWSESDQNMTNHSDKARQELANPIVRPQHLNDVRLSCDWEYFIFFQKILRKSSFLYCSSVETWYSRVDPDVIVAVVI